jgi:thymidine kinase
MTTKKIKKNHIDFAKTTINTVVKHCKDISTHKKTFDADIDNEIIDTSQEQSKLNLDFSNSADYSDNTLHNDQIEKSSKDMADLCNHSDHNCHSGHSGHSGSTPGINKIAFPNGYLKIVTGCMFSGKTTYIIHECKKWQSIGKHVLMINYALDIRYGDQDKIISHDKYSIDCMMIDRFTPKLSKKIEDYDVILINEGQFFPNLRMNVQHWCDELKKIVVVSGLDGDFMRGKFGEIVELISDCDDHIKLKAYCSMCKDGTDAVFTWKIKDRSDDCIVVVDIGTDKYVPLCRKHYNQERKKITNNNNKKII